MVWTFLDTGLRVSEFAPLTKAYLDWQGHRLVIYGKGGQGRTGERWTLPRGVGRGAEPPSEFYCW